ncbi:MAG: heavy metal translocating P-type ATPase [Eubacterium sp.]|nr:heavy metal translocating P-type ATPase [Eubacterium sp.]
MKKRYSIENIDCANCAAKMEDRIGKIPGIKEATLTYTLKRLEIEAENDADPDIFLPAVQKACDSVDEGVVITPLSAEVAKAPAEARRTDEPARANANAGESCGCGCHGDDDDDDDDCGCGHDHKHEDEHDHDDREAAGSAKQASAHTAEQTAEQAAKKKSLFAEHREDFLQLIFGVIAYAAGLVLHFLGLEIPAKVVFVIAYLIVGTEIILNALKNIRKGQLFDENFLMAVATIGAFVVGEFPEAVGVMLFYRVGELFEDIAVDRSREQIMDAVDMRPEVVYRVESGSVREIPAEEAKAGDIIRIRPGDRVPLDGCIVEGESRLDTSPLTGEPVPVTVRPGSEVISGCVNTGGMLTVRVDKPLSESMVTRILNSVENAAASKPQMERFITRFSKIYTPIVVFGALAVAVIPSLITGNWLYWIKTACTFLVISCPCALVLSVPLAFFSGIGAGSRRGILFKGGIALEAIRNIKVLVMDKTGTVTKGNFVLQEIKTAAAENAEELLTLAASVESTSTHPIAHSIVSAAKERNLAFEAPEAVEEIAGKGLKAVVSGREILCGNKRLLEQFGITVPADAGSGYGTEVFAAADGKYLGALLIADTIKPEAAEAVKRVRDKGILTAMLTGDTEENAKAVADATGIDEIHARLLPQDKVDALAAIRKEHGSVMFVGDGINDAPVLAGADVGCAMGSGSDAAIEAADVVFMTSGMDAIPTAVELAKDTTMIAKENVIFALAVKILTMILGLTGHANMWMAVFADSGVAVICVINAIRMLYSGKYKK